MNVFKDGMYYYAFDYLASFLDSQNTSKKQRKNLRQLFRLVNYLKPTNSIEISDDISMSSLTLALPSKKNLIHIFTEKSNKQLTLPDNISLNHSSQLINSLPSIQSIDFILIHSSVLSLSHIDQIIPFCHDEACFVIQAPHKNLNVWNKIKQSSNFHIVIDLSLIHI